MSLKLFSSFHMYILILIDMFRSYNWHVQVIQLACSGHTYRSYVRNYTCHMLVQQGGLVVGYLSLGSHGRCTCLNSSTHMHMLSHTHTYIYMYVGQVSSVSTLELQQVCQPCDPKH